MTDMRASADYRLSVARELLTRYFHDLSGNSTSFQRCPMSVNKPLPHDAAKLHVSGSARYIDDLLFPMIVCTFALELQSRVAVFKNGSDRRQNSDDD